MVNSNVILTIVLLFVLLVGIGIALYKGRKWRCTEGKCELVIGGDCDSKDKCLTKCKSIQEKYKNVSFSN